MNDDFWFLIFDWEKASRGGFGGSFARRIGVSPLLEWLSSSIYDPLSPISDP
jgi:hypothetical protein